MHPPVTLSLLEQRFSLPRMAKYRTSVRGGNLTTAFALYEWNAQISAAFWSTISYVEVLMRNAMHNALTAWAGTEDWFLRQGVFTHETQSAITKACERATRRDTRPRVADQVVAELSFDFWRFLMIPAYDRSLWQPCLAAVWGQPLRKDVENVVKPIYALRNRIAHHEPIYYRNLRDRQHELETLASWICPTTAAWIASHSQITAVLGRRPPTLPRSR